jgi:hypothetical protein
MKDCVTSKIDGKPNTVDCLFNDIGTTPWPTWNTNKDVYNITTGVSGVGGGFTQEVKVLMSSNMINSGDTAKLCT